MWVPEKMMGRKLQGSNLGKCMCLQIKRAQQVQACLVLSFYLDLLITYSVIGTVKCTRSR